MADRNFPSSDEVKKEFESFINQRFGNKVNIFSSQMNPDSDKTQEEEGSKQTDGWQLDFDFKPKDIKAHLDRFVIKQDEAKIALSIAVCDHYNHAKLEIDAHEDGNFDYAKQNVLILGPTGVGKTYLIQKIADLIGVPFVKADATRFSETGYVGANADDLIKDLVQQAEGDIDKAKFGIVYLDEADKLAAPKNQLGRDVNGRGVQFSLLRLMEDSEVDLKSGNDIQSQIQALMDMQKNKKSKISTKNILFIVSGAFSGLSEIIKKRLNEQPIGFHGTQKKQEMSEAEYFHHVNTQDFIEYGFEPEFIGRLPVRVSCEQLLTEDLLQILSESEGSILRQYKASFQAYGIELDFDHSALQALAEKAVHEKTGARALMTVCESVMRKFKYELPSSHIRKLLVTSEIVKNPESSLQNLLDTPDDRERQELENSLDKYASDFLQQHQIEIKFTNEFIDEAFQQTLSEQEDAQKPLKKLLESLQLGLPLAKAKSGEQLFTIDETALNNPESFLEKTIIEAIAKGEK